MAKAIDYYNKHNKKIFDKKGLDELVIEMNKEMKEMKEARKASTDAAVIAIIKEMNNKWNALGRLYEKEYGVEVLIRNGYLNYWEGKLLNRYKK